MSASDITFPDAYVSRAFYSPLCDPNNPPELQLHIRGVSGESVVIPSTEFANMDIGPLALQDFTFEYCARYGHCIPDIFAGIKSASLRGSCVASPANGPVQHHSQNTTTIPPPLQRANVGLEATSLRMLTW